MYYGLETKLSKELQKKEEALKYTIDKIEWFGVHNCESFGTGDANILAVAFYLNDTQKKISILNQFLN